LCSKETNTLTRGLSVCSVPSLAGCLRATSEFLVWTSEQQQQMRQAAAMQQHMTLWQLNGWAKAVAHTACVHYDCCTGQHKVANKGARPAPCCDLAYQRCHLEVCWNRPGALVSDGKDCLGCSTLLTFYHGIRSHAFVTQCVRVPACKHPRWGREETRWCLFDPTHMAHSPCTQKSRTKNAHAKKFVLDDPVSRPDKICTHAQTCQ